MANSKKETAIDTSGKELVELPPKKPRGWNGTPPQTRRIRGESEEEKALVRKLLGEIFVQYNKPRVQNDEQLTARINEYYYECAKSGIIPCIEEMALSTGYTIQHLQAIETGRNKGFSPQTSEIIKKSKEFQHAFDAKLLLHGLEDFITYCFRSKNYYNMKDQHDVIISPTNPLGDELSHEQLAEKYTQGIEIEPEEEYDEE